MAFANTKKRAQRSQGGSGGKVPSMHLAVEVIEIVGEGKEYDPSHYVEGKVLHDAKHLGLSKGDTCKISLRPYDKGYRRPISKLGRKDGNERKVHKGGVVYFENVYPDRKNPGMLSSGWVKAQVHDPDAGEEKVLAGVVGTVYQADMDRGRQQIAIVQPELANQINSIEDLENVITGYFHTYATADYGPDIENIGQYGTPGIVLRAYDANGDPAARGEDGCRFAATFAQRRVQDPDSGEWRAESLEESVARLREVAASSKGILGDLLSDLREHDPAAAPNVVWTVEPITYIRVGPKSMPQEKNGRVIDMASPFTFGGKNKFSLWTTGNFSLKKLDDSDAWIATAALPTVNEYDAEYRGLSNISTPLTPESHARYLDTDGFIVRDKPWEKENNRTNDNEQAGEPDYEAEASAGAAGPSM